MGYGEGHRENLRTRFFKNGIGGFLPHEVVEMLLTYSIPRRDVKPQAHALIDRFGSLSAILDADEEELVKTSGIGPRAAQFFALIRAVAHAYWEQKSLRIDSPVGTFPLKELAEFWRVRLRDEREEHLEIAFLDGTHLLPGEVERLASGAASAVSVLPRQILSVVMRRRCSAVVLCHNHPNGVCLPSEHDERVTRNIASILRSIDVRLLDHLIVANGHVFSIIDGREM
ncbi:MAG: hypothetical protein LBB14_03905 [Puniceicoccales bacterium]|nr:hypothetical protein [Puniceicoccales bacterium]